MLARHAGAALESSLASWSPRGRLFGATGVARPGGAGWVFRDHMDVPEPEARREARIPARPAGGYTLWLAPDGACREGLGVSFRPGPRLVSTARSRRGGIPAGVTMQ